MLKKSVALILTLLILATAGHVLAEEMAREGSATIRAYWIVTGTALPMSKELVQMNYDGYGVVVGDDENALLHNASAQIAGGMLLSKGASDNESGLAIYTRPDGEKIFVTFKGSRQMGKGYQKMPMRSL